MTGFDVQLAALDQAAQAISQTMQDMKSCEVEDIVGPANQYGHDGLHDAFEHFCDRWQYGVKVLVEDGDQVAAALTESKDTYVNADRAAVQSIQSAGTGLDSLQM